jgi:hypothetical protein
LRRYDLVFAKGRAALEALAVGCAVVLCDARGLGPMVTSAEFDDLRKWNFGMRLLIHQPSADRILAEVARYDPADVQALREKVRTNANLDDAVAQYAALYERVIASHARGDAQDEWRFYLRATTQMAGEFENLARPVPPGPPP